MKRVYLLLIVILVGLSTIAQEYTQKWNDFYKRTEFYDAYGRMIGYAKYNDFYNRME